MSFQSLFAPTPSPTPAPAPSTSGGGFKSLFASSPTQTAAPQGGFQSLFAKGGVNVPAQRQAAAQAAPPPPKTGLLNDVENFGKGLIDAPIKTALTAPIDLGRAIDMGAGMLTGNKNLEDAANMDVNIPTPWGDNIDIEPQKAFGQGGGEQVAGKALNYASYLLPAGAAERIGARIGGSALTKGIVGGGLAGAQYGGLGGAGQAMENDESAGQVGQSALEGAGVGLAAGSVLGGLASKLLERSKAANDAAMNGEMDDKRLPVSEKPATVYSTASDVKPGDFVTDSKATAEAYNEEHPNNPVKEFQVAADALIPGARSGEFKYVPKEGNVSHLLQPVGEGEKVVNRNAERAQQFAESKTGQKSAYDELQTHAQANLSDQKAAAETFVKNNPEEFEAVMRGEIPAPAGSLHQVLLNVARSHFMQTEQWDKLDELNHSPLAAQTSRVGQEMRATQEGDEFAGATNQIENERASRVKPAKAKEVENEVKKVKAVKPKKEEWEDFVKRITCGI